MKTEAHTPEVAQPQKKSTRSSFFRAISSVFSRAQKPDQFPDFVRVLLRVSYNDHPKQHRAVLRDHIMQHIRAGLRVIIEIRPQEIPFDCIAVLERYEGKQVSRVNLKIKVKHVEKISLDIQHIEDKDLTVFESMPYGGVVVFPEESYHF